MNRAQPLQSNVSTNADNSADSNANSSAENSAAADAQNPPAEVASVRDSVQTAVRQYLNELDGQMSTEVYQMVLAQVEAPLLEEIMKYTRNNQTKASLMLGLNRGTLRKKLKQYALISDKR